MTANNLPTCYMRTIPWLSRDKISLFSIFSKNKISNNVINFYDGERNSQQHDSNTHEDFMLTTV